MPVGRILKSGLAVLIPVLAVRTGDRINAPIDVARQRGASASAPKGHGNKRSS